MSDNTNADSLTAICLDCRTALHEGERCDGGAARHRVVSLRTPEGRKRLTHAVWGPFTSHRMRQAAASGGGGAILGGALEGAGDLGCGMLDCAGSAGELSFLLAIVAGGVAAVLLFVSVLKLGALISRHRNRPRPCGATRQPSPPKGQRVEGTIVAAAEPLQSPSGEQVVAYGLELHSKRFVRSSVMLRAGLASTFTVRLDDGTTLRIPRGRARVEVPAERAHMPRAESVQALLRQLDPLRPGEPEELDPFPRDRAEELVLQIGDRVEVIAELESVPASEEGVTAHGYRQATTVLEPRNVATVRWLAA